MKNKILVTGGLGFVGFNLIRELVKNTDNDITCIDNLDSHSASLENIQKNVNYIIEDINNIHTGANKLKLQKLKFDVIYHLAGYARIQPSFQNPVGYFQANIMGTANVCELARNNKAKLIYAASSSTLGGTDKNPYTFSKYTGEEILKLYSKLYQVSCVSARFFNVYGDRQPKKGPFPTLIGIFEDQYLKNEPLTITGDGEQRRDFTNVWDICRGLILLSKKTYAGEIYNLGTGENYSINEIAKMFSDQIKYIPKRSGEAKNTLADLTESKKIDYLPSVKISDYIESFKWKNTKYKNE